MNPKNRKINFLFWSADEEEEIYNIGTDINVPFDQKIEKIFVLNNFVVLIFSNSVKSLQMSKILEIKGLNRTMSHTL